MPGGNLTPGDIVLIKIKAEQIWADNQVERDYVAHVDTFKAIKAEQTAKIVPLENKEKDNVVTLTWLTECADMLSDPTNDCVRGGPTPDADSQDYVLNITKKASFTIPEKRFRSSTYSKEEVIARARLAALKQLDEWYTQRLVSAIDSFAGVNQFNGGIATIQGTDNFISATQFNADAIGYFIQAGIINKFKNTYLLNGNNMFQQFWKANNTGGNNDMAEQMARFSQMRKYWDLFNIDAIVGAKKSYLIDRGAIAEVNKAYYDPTPTVYFDHIRYSTPSPSLPGVTYDEIYDNRCVSDEIYHNFDITLKGGVFLNPKGCNADVTGVLSFTCGEAPAGS